MIKVSSLIVVFLLTSLSPIYAIDNMKAFPSADQGMIRYVLQLPTQDNESRYKIELLVGKIVKVDKKNNYFFNGTIKEEIIQGWGFQRYIVNKIGPMAGTLMANVPNSPKVDRFITLGDDPYLIRYNSRLPIVVYVPEGVEVRYRVWTAGAKVKEIKQG